MSVPIRALLVDDNDMVRLCLTVLIETLDNVVVIGEAENGQEAIERCHLFQPDVVLMDLVMPGMDGVTAIQRIHQQQPHLPIFLLTSTVDHDLIDAALRAGATGYILKTGSIAAIIAALHQAHLLEPS